MKQFIDKLIERLEEEHERCINRYGVMGGNLPAMEVKQCMGIVNRLAEEYLPEINVGNKLQTIDVSELLGEQGNDGWIRVEDRLPEEEGYYLITVLFYHLHHPTVMGCHFEDGEWWQIDKEDKVLAWRELPKPYQPKGQSHD